MRSDDELKSDRVDPGNEAERLEALGRYAILDTPPEAPYERVVALAARLLGANAALLSFVDERRQWVKARVGVDLLEVRREASLCAHALAGEGVMVVPDARSDARFAKNPLVAGEPGFCFYAGAPLVVASGHSLGALCVLDTRPRRTFGEAERATLQNLAALITETLERRLADHELAQARAVRHRLESALDCIPESVIITTADLDLPGPEILYVNREFTKMTGHATDDVLGKTPWLLPGPNSDRGVLQRLRAALTLRNLRVGSRHAAHCPPFPSGRPAVAKPGRTSQLL